MAGKTKEEKFSASSLHVIHKTKAEFRPSIVKLANELCVATFHGAPLLTRRDITNALAGDEQIIETMRRYAVNRDLISEDDQNSIPEVLEWIRLVRTVS